MLTGNLVGNGGADERNLDQALAGIDHAFLNSADYFSGFADAYADLALAVAYGNYCAEAQFLSAFDDLGHATYLNDFFFPLRLLALTIVVWSAAGTVTLPMIDEVQVGGMDERAAAHAVEAALVAKGMLLHPQVSVLVTAYAGQDVSVLGEVTRPGVYPFTLHHRLLDLISAASGVAPAAGTLVNIFHRSEPNTPHPVVLDPSGTDTSADHNPELAPGDTMQVSRAGLVYVVGDVIRPGGFPVDPAQGLTVVQALSLAWGPTQNAAAGKALLIREQKGGRTLTTLNLRRMLHGQDPDQPIHDHDILYVPDSMAKNLMNKTMESAIQSAIGVTIYAGLVYSQRF